MESLKYSCWTSKKSRDAMTRVPEPQSSRQSTKAPTFQTLKARQLAAWLRKATNQFLIISQPHNEKLQHNISKLASHLCLLGSPSWPTAPEALLKPYLLLPCRQGSQNTCWTTRQQLERANPTWCAPARLLDESQPFGWKTCRLDSR